MEQIDEWDEGLRIRHPAIWSRLERFLDECADAAGHPRVREKPKLPKVKPNPGQNDAWMEELQRRRDQQKHETDMRNLELMKKMISGEMTISDVLKETKIKNEDSLYNTMKASHLRNGYGDQEHVYLEWIEWRKRKNKEKKAEQPKTIMVWDGYGFVEVGRR